MFFLHSKKKKLKERGFLYIFYYFLLIKKKIKKLRIFHLYFHLFLKIESKENIVKKDTKLMYFVYTIVNFL